MSAPHCGALTLKASTKGEHVLRVEALVHNTKAVGCGRVLATFPPMVARLRAMGACCLPPLHAADHALLPDETLEQWPLPCVGGHPRVGGIDLHKPRLRTVLAAVLPLAPAPQGVRVAAVAAQGRALSGQVDRPCRPMGRGTPRTLSRSGGPSNWWTCSRPRAALACPRGAGAPAPPWSSCVSR